MTSACMGTLRCTALATVTGITASPRRPAPLLDAAAVLSPLQPANRPASATKESAKEHARGEGTIKNKLQISYWPKVEDVRGDISGSIHTAPQTDLRLHRSREN